MDTPFDEYNPQAVEARWQQRWAETAIYRTSGPADYDPPDYPAKFYCLEFFPYPSGAGLSVGHGRNYVPTDVISRYRRMRGDAVLHPMGWDAFGLPAENEAIKRGVHPRETTTRYAANYRRQLTLLGCAYDWEREINSSTPDYYRWTQWFFLLLYRRGLAYRANGRQWWCPGCQTVLANEQVDAHGVCWRGHSGVYRRDMEQWYLRITAYAQELLDSLDSLDWPEHILAMQRNWIGRSEGVELNLPVANADCSIAVYTTRPDTIYGMTCVVLAPEHPLVERVATPEQRAGVVAYIEQACRRSDVERQQQNRAGVFSGSYAVHPLSGAHVPIYVADYVLAGYGGGAIMGVPAHDERDWDFAHRHDIPIRVVVAPPGWNGEPLAAAYTAPGTMVHSGVWDGRPSQEAASQIAAWIEARQIGRRRVQYRMRDWLISRQRYWGAPIPMIYCDRCGVVPVPEQDLPVLLPPIQEWRPGGDGRSPLANVPEFVHTVCPQCGSAARRETDTLDGFACSSWYFLRFVSPHETGRPFDPAALQKWGPPDLYVGGAEHAIVHLLYARFWVKVMADAGLVPFREPFPVLRSQGVMHARDEQTGQINRMSKSAGNVVTPDDMAARHGADALRIYLMFMAPFENNTVWDEQGIIGARRFLERVWRLIGNVVGAQPSGPRQHPELDEVIQHTVASVTADVESFKFNTAISTLMQALNHMAAHHRQYGVTADLAAAAPVFVLLLAPFAPHLAEELWQKLGRAYSVHQQAWPQVQERAAVPRQVETITLVVQVNGKVRDRIAVPADIAQEQAQVLALNSAAVRRSMGGQAVVRTVWAAGRLINLVTS